MIEWLVSASPENKMFGNLLALSGWRLLVGHSGWYSVCKLEIWNFSRWSIYTCAFPDSECKLGGISLVWNDPHSVLKTEPKTDEHWIHEYVHQFSSVFPEAFTSWEQKLCKQTDWVKRYRCKSWRSWNANQPWLILCFKHPIRVSIQEKHTGLSNACGKCVEDTWNTQTN